MTHICRLAVVWILGSVIVAGAYAFDHPVMNRIDAALAAGEISTEDALLNKFHFVFDPSHLAADFVIPGAGHLKCVTPLIIEYETHKGTLSTVAIGTIEGYLDNAPLDGLETVANYISPSGRFYFTYATTGGNAVPAADTNSNGIPDFVEWCADYMDTSHDQIVNIEGFASPPKWSGPGSLYYPVYFQSMSAYGYTTNRGDGQTDITLHNNFYGFPPNDDPQGNQKGAAKVTCVHEYKHASQIVHSNWSEGQWVEVDATWQEDYGAYDVVNDYYNYLQSGNCPIWGPQTTMDPGSYEDCIWQHYLVEVHGLSVMQDFWLWRETHQSQEEKESYHQILLQVGSSWETAWEEFTIWNALCGNRCQNDVPGYEEACDYPNSSITYYVSSYPDYDRVRSISRVAANFGTYGDIDELPNGVNVIIDGPDTGNMLAVSALIDKTNGTWVREIIPLDGSGDANLVLSTPSSQIDQVVLVVSNTNRTSAQGATITVRDGFADAVPGTELLTGTRTTNQPNPFNPRTVIRYDLPADATVNVEIFDAMGRHVRTLVRTGTVPAGLHEVIWDGRSDVGNELSTGVYFYRLKVDGHEFYRKMMLVK